MWLKEKRPVVTVQVNLTHRTPAESLALACYSPLTLTQQNRAKFANLTLAQLLHFGQYYSTLYLSTF